MSMIFDNTALAAFNAQLIAFETAVFEEEYDDIQYSQLIPVDTSAPEWVKGVTYASVAGVGQAKWINGGAQDIPNADITTGETTTEIELGAIGYSYTLEEVSQSQLHNFPLDSSRASAAHRAAEEFIDKVALEGDASKNMSGLFNNANVNSSVAAQPFAGATIEQTIAVINEGLIGNPGVKRSTYAKDTVLLPTSVLQTLGTQIVPNTSQTFLHHVMENNIYTLRTGNRLTIRDVNGLDTAGAGDTTRAVFYKRDPNVVRFHMPMPHKFLPVQQVMLEFKRPGIFRIGGTEVKRTDSVSYIDTV